MKINNSWIVEETLKSKAKPDLTPSSTTTTPYSRVEKI